MNVSAVLVPTFFLLVSTLSGYVNGIPTLYPGSIIQNSTVGMPRIIELDGATEGGQFLFQVDAHQLSALKGQQVQSSVSVSTCSEKYDLDTILLVFEENPLGVDNPNRLRKIAMNDNDCELQSTVEILTASLPVYVLLTGYRGAEGAFEVQVNAVKRTSADIIPWGLDRIDQRRLPLDGQFSILRGGHNVFVYVLDSGIRTTHKEFENGKESPRAIPGVDIVDRKPTFSDETGHGTHVAAIIGGSSFGVAKNATLISVRVIDRNGRGYTSRLIEGLQWTLDDIQKNNRTPAVVVMSLSTKFSASLNDAVEKTDNFGVIVITAAGNSAHDSCLFSPASSKSSISVGAMGKDDVRAEYSNFGQCLDIYAPGESITSAWHTGDEAEKTLSGTSASCPHVAGTVAVLLAENPSMNPAEIRSVLYSTSTFSVVGNHSTGTTYNTSSNQMSPTESNRLVYVRAIPSLPTDGDPKEGTMYIYVIYALASPRSMTDACDLPQIKKSSITELFKSHGIASSIGTMVNIKMCCTSASGGRDGCDVEGPWNVTRMIVRLQTGDILAGAVFEFLSDFTMSQDKTLMLETLLNTKVTLLAEPWVVDARGLKYWTAPVIMQPTQTKLPTSVIISISVALSVSMFLGFLGCGYLYLRRKKAREIANEEAFQSMAAKFEMSNGRQSNLANIETRICVEYQKEGLKRTNTEVNENMFRNANPDLALPTPRQPLAFSPAGPQSVRSNRKQKTTLSSFLGEWGQQSHNTTRERGTGSFSLRRPSFGPKMFPSFITKLATPRSARPHIRTSTGRESNTLTRHSKQKEEKASSNIVQSISERENDSNICDVPLTTPKSKVSGKHDTQNCNTVDGSTSEN
ncbi:alkaline serine protease [Gracilaria domingensis]|nr:alkaline serine protease [Gracilaria domingensis]